MVFMDLEHRTGIPTKVCLEFSVSDGKFHPILYVENNLGLTIPYFSGDNEFPIYFNQNCGSTDPDRRIDRTRLVMRKRRGSIFPLWPFENISTRK